MKKTILLTNNYSGKTLEIIKNELPDGFDLLMLQEVTHGELKRQIVDADYLLVSGRLNIDGSVLDCAKNLKMIQRTGVGLDTLDLDSIRKKGVPLYVNQGINAESVAEHSLLLMLASLRRLTMLDLNTKKGIWKKQEQGITTHELRGKTIGIIGMGSIAKSLVRLLSGFSVDIIYSDLCRLTPEFEISNKLRYVDLNCLFKSSDIISLHCPLTDKTRNLINSSSISKMKKGVIIINTARGQLIKTADLSRELKNGNVAFAGLDVHEEEPISNNYPLANADNVILTPHIAGVTYESFTKMMRDSMRNISKFDNEQYDEIEQFKYAL